LESVV